MCADEKVGDDPLTLPASSTIGAPGIARESSCLHVQRGQCDAKGLERPRGQLAWREGRAHFRPHHIARDKPTFARASTRRIPRERSEGRVRDEDIEQDIRLDGGDHLRLRGPRRRSITASVEVHSFRTPYTASRGSRCPAFLATRRPASSSKSRTSPGRMPRRSQLLGGGSAASREPEPRRPPASRAMRRRGRQAPPRRTAW